MKHSLQELDAHFTRGFNKRGWTRVKALNKADGIEFKCPGCGVRHRLPFRTKGSARGWTVSDQSTSLDDLTFVHGMPVQAKSVAAGCCGAHFFIEGGQAVDISTDLHEPEND